MGFFKDTINKVMKRESADPGTNKFMQVTGSFQAGKPLMQPHDYPSMLRAYKSWVYVCANKNATAFASCNFRLYVAKSSTQKLKMCTRKVNKETLDYMTTNASIMNLKAVKNAQEIEEVTDHPFLDLLKQVNPFMNRFELFEMTDLYQEMVGNCYWYIVRNGLGIPEQIWLLPPDRVKIVPSITDWISGYVLKNGNGVDVPFEPEEVVHFKFPNTRNQYYGAGPLSAAIDVYNINENINSFELSTFRNSAIPPLVITEPEGSAIQEDEWRRIIAKWNATYAGVEQSGRVGWLGGGLQVKQIGLSPKDLAYMAGRKITMQEIAAIFGVPMSKLTSEDVNRSNAETGEGTYQADTVRPRCKRFEEKVNEQILPLYDEQLFYMADDPVPQNREFALKKMQVSLQTGLTTINEERIKEGLEEVEWGNVPIQPQGSVPYTGEKPAPASSSGTTRPPEEPGTKGKIIDITEHIASAIQKAIDNRRVKE
jgi:HK97 family phage portal protein